MPCGRAVGEDLKNVADCRGFNITTLSSSSNAGRPNNLIISTQHQLQQMGQYFQFLNLDKKQCFAGSKFGEFFFDKATNRMLILTLCNEDPEMSWSGDRIIVVGDYQSGYDLPLSLVDKVEGGTYT